MMITAETIDYARRTASRMTPMHLKRYEEDIFQEIIVGLMKTPEQYQNNKQSIWYAVRTARRNLLGITSDKSPSSRFGKMFRATSLMSEHSSNDSNTTDEEAIDYFMDKISFQAYRDNDTDARNKRIAYVQDLLSMIPDSDAKLLMELAGGVSLRELGQRRGVTHEAVAQQVKHLLLRLKKKATEDELTSSIRHYAGPKGWSRRFFDSRGMDDSGADGSGEGYPREPHDDQLLSRDGGILPKPQQLHSHDQKKARPHHHKNGARRWVGCKIGTSELHHLGLGLGAGIPNLKRKVA